MSRLSPPPINLIHVIESSAYGTLSMVCLLANHQCKAGMNVTVIYSNRPETPENIQTLFESNVELINIQMHKKVGLKVFSALRAIRNITKTRKADVVLLHSSIAGAYGRISLSLTDTPVFYVPHCISFMREDIGFIYRTLFIGLEYTASILKNSTYIACSNSEFETIKKTIPFVSCLTVQNAIDTEKWLSPVTERKNKIVVNVGMLRTQKNPMRFANLRRKASEAGLQLDFIWIGDGNDESVKIALKHSGVEVIGRKNPEEIKTILRDSTWFLSTSSWEGLPVAPLEAMATGCVCVLSDCTGNRDIVKNYKTGFLYNDDNEVIDILKKYSDNNKVLSEIAQTGQRYCVENHSQNSYLANMLSVILQNKKFELTRQF